MIVRRVALYALLPLSLAACDQNLLSKLHLPGQKPEAAAPAAAPAAPATPRAPAVSPLEVPIEVGGAKTTLGTANAAFVGVKAFTASGAGWVAAVDGNYAALRRQGARDANVNVRRVDFAEGAEFVGTLADRTFTLNLRGTACRDAAGLNWPMTATVRTAGGNLSGCAAPTGHTPKGFAAAVPTVKAVAAPKPAAPKKTAPKAAPKAAPKPAAPTTPPADTTPAATTPATPTTTPTTPSTTTPATTTPTPTPSTPSTTTPTTPSTPTPATTPTPTPAPSTTPAPATPSTPSAPAASSTTTTTTTTTPAAPSSPTPPLVLPPAGTTPATN